MATVASFRRKLNHEYFFKAVKSSYDMGTAKDQDILNFIAMGSLYKEDFEKITGKPYPEDTNSSAGSNTNDSKGNNSSSASSSTGSAGSTASSSSSESQSSTADSSGSDGSSKGSATTKKSNDSK